MLTRDRRRPAFTLIELLVVISIIAILAALTAAAAFGVRRNMQKQNAEATLTKIDQKIADKVKTIRDQIQDDIKKGTGLPEFDAAKSLTGGNPEGAKAVMLYARLRQQFPMSFAESRTAMTIGSGPTYVYPASPTFRGFQTLPSTATIEESAACLYAALAQTQTGLDGLEQQVGTGPTTGQKVFIDGFGTPIGFIRIAYDGNSNELNTAPQTNNPARDPFDPEGRAVAALTALAGAPNFICGPALAGAGTYPTGYRATGNRNHTIAVFSAGPNRVYAEPTIFDGDNLLSYRLRRLGAKGD
jgi:prepilin-type N-terminal cleavage/methylation domain-containing protein